MKKFCFLLILVFSTLSVAAQDRLHDYIHHANRYARVDLPRYRQHLSKEYRMSRRDLDRCFSRCENNWGYVGLALEIARISGKDIEDICDYYKEYGRRGWKRVLMKLGIEPGSHWYNPFYERINEGDIYWTDCYEDYRHHPGHHCKPHHRHHHNSYDDDCYGRDDDLYYDRDDDDDDDDYFDRDDDDDDDDDYFDRDDDDDDDDD